MANNKVLQAETAEEVSNPVTEEIISTDIKASEFIRKMNSKDDTSLDKIAVEKGYRTYTYRQMFKRWKRYAEVFSALDITEKNCSRVGLVCFKSEESLSIMYALNSMGVSVSLLDIIHAASDRLFKKIIKAEKITDLVVLDEMLLPPVAETIKKNIHNSDIRHIIVGKTKFAAELEDRDMRIMMNFMRKRLLAVKGIYYLSDLLKEYEAYPVKYGSGRNDESAFIVHTTGTTKGISKPVPLSDRALNNAALSISKLDGYKDMVGRTVAFNFIGPSNAYCLVDVIHFSFATGGKIVISSLRDARSYKVIKDYGVNILLGFYSIINILKHIPTSKDHQYFSGLKLMILGGEFVSCNMAGAFKKQLQRLGFKGKLLNGYGISECSGAVLLNDNPEKSEWLNKVLPGTQLMLYNEEACKYVGLLEEPCCGGLYICSDSVSRGKIGDDEFFKLVKIKGKNYYCTNDAFESDGKGNLRFIGRMNRYFVNNEGVRFDPALIENEMAKKQGVEACAVTPGYSKLIHDTVPVLYVQNNNINKNDIRRYLKDIFIQNDLFKKTNLPAFVVMVDRIPRNRTGKPDVYGIMKEGLDGKKFIVEPVKKDEKLADILFKIPLDTNPYIDNFRNVPDEISRDFKEQIDGMKFVMVNPPKRKDEGKPDENKASMSFDLFEIINNPDEAKAVAEFVYDFILLQISDYKQSDSYGFVPYMLNSSRAEKMMKMFNMTS